jgi:hypothetical protein
VDASTRVQSLGANSLDCLLKVFPWALSGRKALAHPLNEIGELAIADAVAKPWHETRIDRGRGLNSVEDDPNQIVGSITIEIGIECERQVLPQ